MAEESPSKPENSDSILAAIPHRIKILSGMVVFIILCFVLPALVAVLLPCIPIAAYMFDMGNSSRDIGAKEGECCKEREGDLLNGKEIIADAGSIPREQFSMIANSMEIVAGTDDNTILAKEEALVRRLQVAFNRLCVAKGTIKTMGDEVQFFEAVSETRELLQNALSGSRETLREVFGGKGNAYLHLIRRVVTEPPLSHSDPTEASRRSIDLANCLSACESVEKVLDDLGSFRPFQQDGPLTGEGEIALATRSLNGTGFPNTAVLTQCFPEYYDGDVPSLEFGKIEECKVAEALAKAEEERLVAERAAAEERRLAKEAATRAEEDRKVAEVLAKAEEDRLAKERAVAEERRLAEEAALRVEEERKVAEVLAKAEEDRLIKERAIAEERRLAEEALLRVEEERKVAEALAKAEEDRLIKERAVAKEKRLAEEAALRVEEERKVALAKAAEERRLAEEEALKLEEGHKIADARAKAEQERPQEDVVGGHWEERITEHTINVWVPEVRRRKATVLGIVAEPLGQHTPTIPCEGRLLSQDSVLPATPQTQTLTPSKTSACNTTNDGFGISQTVISKERSASTCETGGRSVGLKDLDTRPTHR